MTAFLLQRLKIDKYILLNSIRIYEGKQLEKLCGMWAESLETVRCGKNVPVLVSLGTIVNIMDLCVLSVSGIQVH